VSKNGCGLLSSSIAIIIFLCVCFDVTYSGEYNVSDVTLSVYPGTPELGGGAGTGTPELGGGRRGSRPCCPLPRGARGAKVSFQFKGLPWRNSELSEMLVQFFYKFASENARNAVIELQE
jgi:hypothetical protein